MTETMTLKTEWEKSESIQDKEPSWGNIITKSRYDKVFISWTRFFRNKNVELQVVQCSKIPGEETFHLQLYQKWWKAKTLTRRRP